MSPMLLAQSTTVPSFRALTEPKLDGFRAVAFAYDGRTRSLTGRGGGKLARRFPLLAATLADAVDADRVLLDGEIIAGNGDVESFDQLLAGAGAARSPIPVTYVVFDILAVDGETTTHLPIEERKKILARVVRDTGSVVKIRSYDDAAALFALADKLHLEGIVVKASGSRYYPGQRSGPRCWVKVKTRHARIGDGSWGQQRAAS